MPLGGSLVMDRTDWIDAIKGVAISLIVLGHIVWARPLSNYFYAISIPLFFIISGYLFNLDKYAGNTLEFIKNRFFSLIVPYISATIIAAIVGYILNIYNKPLYILLYIFFIETIVTGAMALPHIWFLPSLFACEIVFYFLSKYTYKKRIYMFIAGILIITYLSMLHNKNRWFALSVYGLFAIGFYGVGFVFRDKFEDVFFKKGIELSFIFSILFYIFAGTEWVQMPGVSGMKALYYYIIALLGIFPIIYTIKKIYEHQIKLIILEYYGRNSLIVFLIHVPLINLIYNYIVPVNVINVWVIVGIIFISCLPFIYLINNFSPFIIGKRRSVVRR
jgi:acyltransferase